MKNVATLDNWRKYPFAPWAFHNVRELIPTSEIENSPLNIWALGSKYSSDILTDEKLRGSQHVQSFRDSERPQIKDHLIGGDIFDQGRAQRNGMRRQFPGYHDILGQMDLALSLTGTLQNS